MNRGRRIRRAVLTWVVGLGLLRLTLWAPEVCPAFTADEARAAAVNAGAWIEANQSADGTFLYEWDRASETASPDYNLVRHAGVTMSLYQLVVAGQIEFLATADRGLDYMLDHLVTTTGGGTAFTTDGIAKLGAAALLTVSLAQRRLATEDVRYDEIMRGLGQFMRGQVRPDRSLLDLYDLNAQAPVPDRTSLYSAGEANWAFALLHEAFPGEGFDADAIATLDYLATDRDTDEDFFPQPWPDQWASYTLGEMAEWGLSDIQIEYARELLARYALLIRTDSQRGSRYGALTHGPAVRGAGMGTWIEGLAALRPITLADARLADAAAATDDVLACGAARLGARQVDPGPGVPVQNAGAWFTDNATRMDDQQHAASGLLGAESVLP